MYIERCNSYCMYDITNFLTESPSNYDDHGNSLLIPTDLISTGSGISQKSLVKFLNKSTSLQTLSLENVQVSDMVSPP